MLDATDALLRTVDLDRLPDVVDVDELPRLVDLLEFGKAKRTFDRELEDVLGDGASIGSDSEAVADTKAFVASLRPEANQALVQQEASEMVKGPRAAVVAQHAELERLYDSNTRHFRNANKRRTARNPTAVSLHPSGPLPDSVSTRLSTVPSDVPHATIDAHPRIYGRRWRTVGAGRGR